MDIGLRFTYNIFPKFQYQGFAGPLKQLGKYSYSYLFFQFYLTLVLRRALSILSKLFIILS